ncbi:MAG: glycosyltransferase family 2 protein [Anaerolineales bacterium]|nr:glycosyltransferase family 2 protein [Anaerolineales bacterium]MCW5856126.1 glycosyltransferase family 2 protein [Anaerolineales bacterium]
MTELSQISVIIPAYNEEIGLATVLAALTQHSALQSAEIIVVDDGSKDKTAEVAARNPKVQITRREINMGYGASISRGIRLATRPYVIWFDGDNQHRVEDLILVAQTLIAQDLDYCIGVRTGDSYQEPSRWLGKLVLRWAVNYAVGSSVADFNSGLRGFRRSVILKYLNFLPKGFGASTVTTLLMLERDHVGAEVPIVVHARQGRSQVKQLRDGSRTLLIILRIFLLFKPLRFFGGIGAALILLGLVYGLYRAFAEGLGFPTLGLLSIVAGLQSFFFGLLADQISMARLDNLD